MEVYAAQVDRMDAGVGTIIAALKEAGQFENTLILFLADNGGCAERMGRAVHIDRVKAPATQPRPKDKVQVEVLPRPSSAQAAPRSTAARGADRDQSRHARRSV